MAISETKGTKSCARLSWPFRQLLSACIVSYRACPKLVEW